MPILHAWFPPGSGQMPALPHWLQELSKHELLLCLRLGLLHDGRHVPTLCQGLRFLLRFQHLHHMQARVRHDCLENLHSMCARLSQLLGRLLHPVRYRLYPTPNYKGLPPVPAWLYVLFNFNHLLPVPVQLQEGKHQQHPGQM